MAIEAEIRKIIEKQGYCSMQDLISLNNDRYQNKYKSPEDKELINNYGMLALNVMKNVNNLQIIYFGNDAQDLEYLLLNSGCEIKNIAIILQKFNKKALQDMSKERKNIQYYSHISEVPYAPSLIILHKFLSRLPIIQFVKTKEDWYEVVVVADPNSARLKFDTKPLLSDLSDMLSSEHQDAYDGDFFEESRLAIEVLQSVLDYMNHIYLSQCIIIDDCSNGDYVPTLRAVSNNTYYPILDKLYESTIVSKVDFNALKQVIQMHQFKAKEFQNNYLKILMF